MQAKFIPGSKALNLRSPLSGWLGGKWLLSRKIVPLLPAHNIYIEPFLGAGWVLIRKPKSRMEVANDINGDLVNCWKIIRDCPEELEKRLARTLISRQMFNEYRDMTAAEIAELSPAENAWRLLYLLKLSFGGRSVLNVTQDEAGKSGKRPSFATFMNVTEKSQRHPKLLLLERYLLPAHERIKAVTFENLPWQKLINFYDRQGAFFYLDPPYIGYEKDYGTRFANSEFEELAAMLSRLKGKFFLSLNDCEQALNLFAGFHIYRTSILYSINNRGGVYKWELFISNYPLDESLCQKHEVVKL